MAVKDVSNCLNVQESVAQEEARQKQREVGEGGTGEEEEGEGDSLDGSLHPSEPGSAQVSELRSLLNYLL